MRHTTILTAAALMLTLACGSTAGTTRTASAAVAPGETVAAVDTLYTTTSLKEAKRYAKQHDARILMVFAGSDWCRPCKQFKAGVLDDASFRESVKEDIVVLYLDFPSKRRNQLPPKQKAANEALAEQYNPQGIFPRIVLIDAAEHVLGELKYTGEEAAAFETQLSSLLDG